MNREAIFTAGNVAVVTGAALGIGRTLSKHLAARGMSVVMADLPGKELSEAVAAAQKSATAGSDTILEVPTDVSDQVQIENLKATTLRAFGKLDFLVNNAVTRIGRGFDADLSEWRRALDTNLWGPIYAVREFLPSMLENPGPSAVVNVGSKQGITNPPGHPIYNMSKSAIKTYTELL